MKSRVTAGQGDPAIGPPATIRVTVTFSQIRYECSEVVGAPLLIAVISCSSGGGKCIIYFWLKDKISWLRPRKIHVRRSASWLAQVAEKSRTELETEKESVPV